MSKNDVIVILQTAAINSAFEGMFTEYPIAHSQYRVMHIHAPDNLNTPEKVYNAFEFAPVMSNGADAYNYALSLEKKCEKETGLPPEFGIVLITEFRTKTMNQIYNMAKYGGTMIEIITRPDCSFCDKAKKLLIDQGLSYTERIIGENITRERVKELYPDATMLPVIIMDNQYVGGYPELLDKIFPTYSENNS